MSGRAVMILLLVLLPGQAAAERIVIDDFVGERLDGWQERSFAGHTDYRLARCDGKPALRAKSHDAASGIVRERRIDLTRTPYLNWSWRIDRRLQGVEERSRAGDDYPARVYVVISGGLFFWRTRALNYVWSSTQASGSQWPNAYTGHAAMLAVRGKGAETGRWYYEKRNVRKDLRRVFGEEIDHIDAIAIMTDTDNSHQGMGACYGAIYFSGE